MECKQCDIDKNWNRTTFTSKHNKTCKQYSDYDDKMEEQDKYAATLSQVNRCLWIHSWARPIDANSEDPSVLSGYGLG